jgi:outer membrane protein insertion porin family
VTSRLYLRLALSLALLLGLAHAQQYPIVELVARGSDRIPSADLLTATGLRVDPAKDVSLVDVRKVAERLVGSGLFAEVNYKHTQLRNGMKVEFVVKDKPADQFVPSRFENFPWWSEQQLLSELHARLPLFSGQLPIGGGLADDVALEIDAMLKTRSVSNAQVTQQVHNAPSGIPDSIAFELEDWPVHIAQLTIPGASAQFEPELQKTGSRLVGLNYRRSTIGTFADSNLKKLYLAKGYLRAQFSPPQVQVVADKDSETLVSVAIPVQEGLQYSLGSVHWAGNQVVSSADLQKGIHSESGQPIDGVKFARDIAALRTDYARRGYLHMLAAVTPAYDDAAKLVNYNIAVTEGDLFSMGKFNVDGLTPASTEKIRQLWKLREGEPFDVTYLKSFFGTFRTPAGTPYVVEQSEGEAKNSVDVTIVFCQPNTPCHPASPNVLYAPDVADPTVTTADTTKPAPTNPK